MRGLDVSLIIPTYNERPNITPLVAEITQAMAGLHWEALFVDDSTDGTDAEIARLSLADPRLRLLHRAENHGGLAGAVVDGLSEADGTYVCVIDADLQHPPAMIPLLLAEATRETADLVIASRYLPGGSDGGLAGPLRHMASCALKYTTRLIFPRRLAQVTDPLSGFFLLRRSLVDGVTLQPTGYKILLELLVRCDWQTVRELPYVFQPRAAGNSKADLHQGLRFLGHLGTLARDCSPVFALLRSGVRQPNDEQSRATLTTTGP